jgi:competence ComEA-like helix-hairpin-helix protein
MAPVDINTASGDELAAVNGLGDVLAEAIVTQRDTHGPYRTLDDLLEVPGISARLLAKIRDQLTVGTPASHSVEVQLEKADPAAPGGYDGHGVDITGAYMAGDDRG